MHIVNPWKSDKLKKVFLENTEEVKLMYKIDDYSIYRKAKDHYIYTYKRYAFCELAGLNKQHLDNIATRTPPTDIGSGFIYESSIRTLKLIHELDKGII